MKKYLMNGAMALVLGAMAASCSNDEGFSTYQDAKQAEYDAAFKAAFGKIGNKDNWGFGTTSRGITRTVDTNSNEWADKGYNIPSDITPREKEVVMEWFATHKNPTSETVDIHNYFVQNVGHGGKTYTSTPDQNGFTHDSEGSAHMDWIFCGPGYYMNEWEGMTEPAAYTWDNGEEHINNFNAYSGEIQHILYTGSEYFGFHDSFQDNGAGSKYSTINRNFVLRFIDVDGEVGCYVGFDYESHGQQGDIDPDGFFNDRVIKLVPGVGSWDIDGDDDDEVKTSGRIFCEDMGSIGDFDFNDVVFDAYIYESGKIKIEVLAAGGTLPISVAGQAISLGKMVNTGVTNTGKTQVINISAETAAANNWTSLISIPIVVSQTDPAGNATTFELAANAGEAPQKICVPVGTKWADEYVNLGIAYPGFKAWVNGDASTWTGNPVATFVDLDLSNNE